jgi:hypothetical protein
MYEQRKRHGEAGSIPFRTGRYYTVENEWWFAIRRGPDQGPYASKPAAKQALIEYLHDQFEFEKHLQNGRLVLSQKLPQLIE